jgi:predicted aspartyl protease
MTTGFITSDQEPALHLEVVGPEGARSFKAIIDTGFNGGLALPPDWIEALGLPRAGHEQMVLADGSVTGAYLYDGYAILDEEAYDVVVAEAPGIPLAGTDLFWGFSLYIEFEPDGTVDAAPLPSPSS